MPPDLLRRQIGEGVLAFPATPFTPAGELDADAFERHAAFLASHRPCALVPAGGAGELFSLSIAEHETIVKLTVAAAGDIPVIAGAGQGIAIAAEMARAAERAGAAAILLFPPYLIAPEQQGLAAYVEHVCRSVSIGVVVYSRNNGVVSPKTALQLADSCPNLVGIKDGTGDFEQLVGMRQLVGDRLVMINGVPTAELIAPQCFAMGTRSYSSAVFSFMPPLAARYFRAVRDGEQTVVDRLLREFYVPLGALRGRKRGYAVSIVKAGLRVVGRPAGPVRPPLTDLTADEERELETLMSRAGRLLDELGHEGKPPMRALG
jgi:5-dehydro-4-deoxyglucarate dehydratase